MNILIRREKEFSYWSTRIKVQIDSFYVGELSNGEEKLFPVSDGPHYVSFLVGKKVYVTVPVMQQPDMPDPFISCRFNMKGDIEITGSTSGLPPQAYPSPKRQTPPLGWLPTLLIVLAAFIVMLLTFDGNNNTKSATVPQTSATSDTAKSDTPSTSVEPGEPETITVSAEDLWAAYDANKVKADSLYKGKILDVTGVISDITQDVVTKDPCVTLEAGDTYGFYSILCFFDGSDETASIIAELSDGQTITVRGKCSGTPIAQVQMSKCMILE